MYNYEFLSAVSRVFQGIRRKEDIRYARENSCCCEGLLKNECLIQPGDVKLFL